MRAGQMGFSASFFGYFPFWRDRKKVTRPPGRDPACNANQNPQTCMFMMSV